MSAKTMPSVKSENRDLRKQIGCMNGIFQLFDRRHFLTGRRVSSHNHNRLLQGGQNQPDPQYATKTFMEKGVETQKEKPRISTESSRASFSSSSCSSTFSSLDCNKLSQPEMMRQPNIPESPLLNKGMQPLDLRDVVKDSMYREARALPIKSQPNGERRGTVMKHIDSPRPSQSSKFVKPKATGFEGATKYSNKEERLALPPRFSYDGRESRETFKSSMKIKEIPRLSLDSKASSIKYSVLESRMSLLGRDPHMENDSPGHSRTSSVVAKLMGLETCPDDEIRTPTTKSCTQEASFSKLTSKAEESKQNQVGYFPRVSQSNPASPSPRSQCVSPVRKQTTCSRFPLEPAPWRQQELSSQGSPRMASQTRRASVNTPHLSSSVYGQIEKRLTEIEFKRSGKDLRALKQILEAMQKTRDRLEDQRGDSAEFMSDQNSNLSTWKIKKSYNQDLTNKGPCTPIQLAPSVVITRPAKMNRLATTEISHLQRIQTGKAKYHRGNSAHMQKATDLAPKNNNLKDPSRHLPSKPDRTLAGSHRMKIENCAAPGRSFRVVSPRLQQNVQRMEGQSQPTTPSSDLGRVRKHCNKKSIEKGSQNRKHKVKAKDLQLSDDQLSERSSETRYSSYQGDTASVKSESNNSLISQTEAEVISLPHSINTKSGRKENFVSTTRERVRAVETAVTMPEQPSPISVLDATFYCEESPSPVKKISTAFREDESPSPDEAEWHLDNLHHLTDCTRSNHSGKYNQELEITRQPVHELRLFNNGPDETARNHNVLANGSLDPDHRYINKILLTSGLLNDSSFISTTGQLLSTHRLINPDMFHVLEQTEEIMEGLNEQAIEKIDRLNLNKKTRRKILFDMVDEVLVRKITSGRLFPVGKKRASTRRLLKEVYLEMERVCKVPDSNLDDEEDEMTRLLTEDMKYQSEDWADCSGEVPALVLDIERLIFKDLINEVVTGEIKGFQSLPKRHIRQLFSK